MEQSDTSRLELPLNIIALVPMRNVVLFPHVLMQLLSDGPNQLPR